MSVDLSWLLVVFFVVGVFLKLQKPNSSQAPSPQPTELTSPKAKITRPLKPRSAVDCPLCRGAKLKPVNFANERLTVRP